MKPEVSRIAIRVNAAAFALVVGLFGSACSHAPSPPTAPSAAAAPAVVPNGPTPAPAGSTLSLNGTVTDSATSVPIPGASVVFSNPAMYATTDSAGRYGFTGVPNPNNPLVLVWVSASNYERDFRYYGSATQDFHLYRIDQITAGSSTAVTVAPNDSVCVNNVQDTPPWPVCRTVRVMAPADGVMTVEAVSAQDGTRPPLEVGNRSTCRAPDLLEDASRSPRQSMSAPCIEVVASIQMPSPSTASQTYPLTTSMAGP